jgi:uncharacterized cupin superfamily protein
MSTNGQRPILNLADAPQVSGRNGEHFEFGMSSLAASIGGRSIGANVTRVPPGKAAFPIHHHRANEEHFFILSGAGTLRLGTETFPVRQHDYIVNLPGEAADAHQLVNTGTGDLVYLAISTQVLPEVVGYPDSGKTGVRVREGQAPDARFLVDDDEKTRRQYWDREDGAEVEALVRRARGLAQD